MQRCSQCILPDNYPKIKLNDRGVCNFCTDHKIRQYPGDAVFKQNMESHLQKYPDREYDCILAFSGGRDSSFLLHYLVKVLHFKVLACTIDTGFVPEQTLENVHHITKLLNVDLVIEKKDYLQKCVRHNVSSWMNRPSVAMIAALCTGCRLALAEGCYEITQKYNAPIYISGGTPYEAGDYRTDLIRSDPKSTGKRSLFLGYFTQIAKNPRWIMNPYYIMTQFREFRAFYGRLYKKKMIQDGILYVSPYHEYIRWEEEKVISTIEDELHWKKNPSIKSKWRGDCDIALLKLYLYRKYLGFNDKDDGLSCLIRDRQISRREALDRIEEESFVPEPIIEQILDRLDLSYSKFQKKLNQSCGKHPI